MPEGFHTGTGPMQTASLYPFLVSFPSQRQVSPSQSQSSSDSLNTQLAAVSKAALDPRAQQAPSRVESELAAIQSTSLSGGGGGLVAKSCLTP